MGEAGSLGQSRVHRLGGEGFCFWINQTAEFGLWSLPSSSMPGSPSVPGEAGSSGKSLLLGARPPQLHHLPCGSRSDFPLSLRGCSYCQRAGGPIPHGQGLAQRKDSCQTPGETERPLRAGMGLLPCHRHPVPGTQQAAPNDQPTTEGWIGGWQAAVTVPSGSGSGIPWKPQTPAEPELPVAVWMSQSRADQQIGFWTPVDSTDARADALGTRTLVWDEAQGCIFISSLQGGLMAQGVETSAPGGSQIAVKDPPGLSAARAQPDRKPQSSLRNWPAGAPGGPSS